MTNSTSSEALCLSCGEKASTMGTATVPLCGACKSLSEGHERGVERSAKPQYPKLKLV